jgi:hypothetical protein
MVGEPSSRRFASPGRGDTGPAGAVRLAGPQPETGQQGGQRDQDGADQQGSGRAERGDQGATGGEPDDLHRAHGDVQRGPAQDVAVGQNVDDHRVAHRDRHRLHHAGRHHQRNRRPDRQRADGQDKDRAGPDRVPRGQESARWDAVGVREQRHGPDGVRQQATQVRQYGQQR